MDGCCPEKYFHETVESFVRYGINFAPLNHGGVSTMAGTKKSFEIFSPENVEFEMRKAYNSMVELGMIYCWDRRSIPGIDSEEVDVLYRHAFHQYRKENRLAAERWARAAKHLARALECEAKIVFLEPRTSELPYLEGAQGPEYDLHEHSDTTADLLNSVAEHIPSPAVGFQGPFDEEVPKKMKHYLVRGREHLEILNSPEYKHELLRAERIKAAYEYGRVLECMALAYEADTGSAIHEKKAA